MMPKRAVIIHCWGGNPDYCWYPYAKKELEAKGFEVKVPAMPKTDMPKQTLWVTKLAEVVGSPDDQTFLVGHSIGCATIMRYLEQLKPDQKVGGVVLVAGFTDNLGFEEISNFFNRPINFEKIKSHSPSFIGIFSDNDPDVPLKHAKILEEKLGSQNIIKHNAGHFSGPHEGTDEACLELPEVVKSVLSLTK